MNTKLGEKLGYYILERHLVETWSLGKGAYQRGSLAICLSCTTLLGSWLDYLIDQPVFILSTQAFLLPPVTCYLAPPHPPYLDHWVYTQWPGSSCHCQLVLDSIFSLFGIFFFKQHFTSEMPPNIWWFFWELCWGLSHIIAWKNYLNLSSEPFLGFELLSSDLHR